MRILFVLMSNKIKKHLVNLCYPIHRYGYKDIDGRLVK